MIVQKITPYGPVSIDGGQFTFRGKDGKAVSEIASEKELQDILKREFQIEISL